jgi:hypothetical protein
MDKPRCDDCGHRAQRLHGVTGGDLVCDSCALEIYVTRPEQLTGMCVEFAPPASNPFADRNRRVKAAELAAAVLDAGISKRRARRLDVSDWLHIAAESGVAAPSQTTIELALDLIDQGVQQRLIA